MRSEREVVSSIRYRNEKAKKVKMKCKISFMIPGEIVLEDDTFEE